MDEISVSSQSMLAELLQRCLDGEFDEAFPERGSFVRRLYRNLQIGNSQLFGNRFVRQSTIDPGPVGRAAICGGSFPSPCPWLVRR
jgi:hypothetical protein